LEDNKCDKLKLIFSVDKNKWFVDQVRAKRNMYMVISHIQMARKFIVWFILP